MRACYFLLFLLSSCTSNKIYRKQLSDNTINLNWYHYSYISSSSPEYITISKNGKEEIIFEGRYGLQDIEINDKIIIISHLKFQIKPIVKKEKGFEYIIKYKEVSSHEIYLKHLENNNLPN